MVPPAILRPRSVLRASLSLRALSPCTAHTSRLHDRRPRRNACRVGVAARRGRGDNQGRRRRPDALLQSPVTTNRFVQPMRQVSALTRCLAQLPHRSRDCAPHIVALPRPRWAAQGLRARAQRRHRGSRCASRPGCARLVSARSYCDVSPAHEDRRWVRRSLQPLRYSASS